MADYISKFQYNGTTWDMKDAEARQALASCVNNGYYDSNAKKIILRHGNTTIVQIDATDFIKDGMVSNVQVVNGYLVITFNTDAGQEPIRIPITDIFNPDNYYTKSATNGLLALKQDLIQDLAQIRQGASAGATAYQKPQGGIPLSDINQNGIDNVPTNGSNNLLRSGGVQNELALGAVYDVSAHNNSATFASLSALLNAANIDTLIPTSVRKGGMSIKFVLTSDNKYVQYRLMSASFTTDETQWQGGVNINLINSVLEIQDTTQEFIGSVEVTADGAYVYFPYNVGVGEKFIFRIKNMTNLQWGAIDIESIYPNNSVAQGFFHKSAPQSSSSFTTGIITANVTAVKIRFRYSYAGAIFDIYKVEAGKSERLDEIDENIEELIAENDHISLQDYITHPIIADMAVGTKGYDNYMPSAIRKFDIVSSGENYIELSATDAAECTTDVALAVKFDGGKYEDVYFLKPDATNKLYRMDFEDADLTDAISCMGVFDTPAGGMGLHLSIYGYMAYANTLCEQINRTCFKGWNYAGGLIMNELTLENSFFIKNSSGSTVCTMRGSSNWKWAGTTISTDLEHRYPVFGWNNKALTTNTSSVKQDNGAYIEFPIKCSGGKGYIEITAASKKRTKNNMTLNTSMGYYKASVYSDGLLIQEFELKSAIKKYIVDDIDLGDIVVRFTNITDTGQESAQLVLYSINTYSLKSTMSEPLYNNYSKIAFLGDSWTQFPLTTQPAEQGLSTDEDFVEYWEEIPTRPDGTLCNGYCVFPRRTEELLNCKVDNWGANGTRADNYGLVKIDEILNHTNYDAVVIEFFLNDSNASISPNVWKKNIQYIVQKCLRKNIRPIIIAPNQAASGGAIVQYHDMLMSGFYGNW